MLLGRLNNMGLATRGPLAGRCEANSISSLAFLRILVKVNGKGVCGQKLVTYPSS